MKRIVLIGRSESGKTTLATALRGEVISYKKTQSIDYTSEIIDTPGEYAETSRLSGALAVYSCEADVIGLVISATEPYSLFPPNIVPMSTRPVVGIVTKCDAPNANRLQAKGWLELCGCKKVFFTSSVKQDGIQELLSYLAEDVNKQDIFKD